MKKITLTISTLLLSTTSAFAINADKVAQAVNKVNQTTLTKDAQNIKKFESLLNSDNFPAFIVASANLITTTTPEYQAFMDNQNLKSAKKNIIDSKNLK